MISSASVFGLFPEFRNGHLGGIEASGAIAWQALSSISQTRLICYSKDGGANGLIARDTSHSRVSAMRAVFKQTSPPDLLLVWHIGMLKLLPFFRVRPERVVVFLHGIEVWKKQDWLTQRLLRQVNRFLVNSDYTWQTFLSFNPTPADVRHETVWLGLGSELSAPPENSRSSQPIALMLSRLSGSEDYKGHRETINAWPMVIQNLPNAELWIAGDGDLRPHLEKLARELGVADQVKFLGVVSEERKQELLQQSHCLLMPSRGEGFGLVYLEAMRVGRPCLVSTLDAGREVVNPPEGGLAVDPENGRELVDAICRLLTDGPEWQQWSRQARERYERNFTARHFQKRLLAALFPNEQMVSEKVETVPEYSNA